MQIVKLYVCLGWSKNWAGRLPKEWQKQTELKRWIATDRRWNRKDVSRGSSETRKRRWPRDERNSQHAWLIGPKVSIARGKRSALGNVRVFLLFRVAAASAAESVHDALLLKSEAATLSVKVTSQVTQRPSCHGMSGSPSGRLPSDMRRPCDFLSSLGHRLFLV